MKFFSVMEWNSKSPPEWDWENLAMFGAKPIEIPKRLQPSSHGIEGDGGIENGSPYSPGVGDFTGSDLGHGSSSKSSISASADSSSKEGMETFRTAVCLSDTYSHKELTNENSTGNFATLGASVGSSEQIIGLKLGKRTYFEDICATSTTKTSSFSVTPTSSATTTKRSRASYQSTQAPHCQVEGCNLDLKSAKDYHRRHRICESHSKSPKVIVAGMERRFCQQCSRLHDLSEFDEKKRSCRRRLSNHNARRRRPQSEATPFNSARMSSSLYDVRRHMNIVFNRTPIPDANSTWQSLCNLKYAQAGSSLVRPTKAVGADRQLHLPTYHMPDAISMLRKDSDRVLSFEGNTSRINNQGLGASSIASNSHVAPDLRRALSLLSTNCFGLSEPDTTSLDQFMHVNQTSMAPPVMHAELPNWALASSQYVQSGQPHNAPQVHPLDLRNSGSSQFQEFSVAQSPL